MRIDLKYVSHPKKFIAKVSFIHSFYFAINQKHNNRIKKYIKDKIIYNIPTKLFTRLNVIKARKPI